MREKEKEREGGGENGFNALSFLQSDLYRLVNLCLCNKEAIQILLFNKGKHLFFLLQLVPHLQLN